VIDPALFTVTDLLAAMLDDRHGNVDPWRKDAEILPAYRAPFAKPGDPTRCIVRCGGMFLRYSVGCRSGHLWDIYGDDYLTPAYALLALCEAPPPPSMLKVRS
jgi:hypothetical protein